MSFVKLLLLFWISDQGFPELYLSCERVSQCAASGWDRGQSYGNVSDKGGGDPNSVPVRTIPLLNPSLSGLALLV